MLAMLPMSAFAQNADGLTEADVLAQAPAVTETGVDEDAPDAETLPVADIADVRQNADGLAEGDALAQAPAVSETGVNERVSDADTLPIANIADAWQDASRLVATAGISAQSFAVTSEFTTNATPFDSGNGSSSSPYTISKAEQLAWLAEVVNLDYSDEDNGGKFNQKSYKLTANIDLSGYDASVNGGRGWIPIGFSRYENGKDYSLRFEGNFDGGGYTISGLYVNCEKVSNSYAGLFGSIVYGNIKNLKLVDVEIIGYYDAGGLAGWLYGGSAEGIYVEGKVNCHWNAGGIVAGSIGSRIIDCHVSGTISTAENEAGGIVGSATVDQSNAPIMQVDGCSFSGEVNGNWAGGISAGFGGQSSPPAMSNCSVSGTVSGIRYAGGLVAEGGQVTNCRVAATVICVDEAGGGLVGRMTGGGTVERSYFTGTVSGGALCGGLVGNIGYSILKNCYFSGRVIGNTDAAGGVAGYSVGEISNCYATGTVNGKNCAGGVVGANNKFDPYLYRETKGCVALTQNVVGANIETGLAGRVAGKADEGILSGNRAFAGMTNGNGVAFSGTNTGDGTGGLDVASADAVSPSFWAATMGWDTTGIWYCEQGKLPVLRTLDGSGVMAGQNGTPPTYLAGTPEPGGDLAISPTGAALIQSASAQALTFVVTGFEEWAQQQIGFSVSAIPANAGVSVSSAVNGTATLTIPPDFVGTVIVTAAQEDKGKSISATVTVNAATNTVEKHFDTFEGSGTLHARVDADHTLFKRLLYGGEEVHPSNYEISQGSTVITLNESYLKTFANGSHWLVAEFLDGTSALIAMHVNVSTSGETPLNPAPGGPSFNPAPGGSAAFPASGASSSPKTGDAASPLAWIVALIVSALAIFALILRLIIRKRSPERKA